MRRPPKSIVKRSDRVRYIEDFIDVIDLRLVHMHDLVDGDAEPGCYYLRHDGCGNLDFDVALRHAEIEANHGLSATYFLMTPGSYPKTPKNYYGWWEDGRIVHDAGLVDRCKRLRDLGHSLGLHNDLVSMSLIHGVPAGELLEREVAFFDEHGVRLQGTAAHGQPLCRELSYNNREMFEGCIRSGWETGRVITYHGNSVQLHQLRMEDFGFSYEAYSLPRDSRISESGARWGGRIAGYQIPRDELNDRFDIEKFRSIIARASASNGVKAFAVLTHPSHWDVV